MTFHYAVPEGMWRDIMSKDITTKNSSRSGYKPLREIFAVKKINRKVSVTFLCNFAYRGKLKTHEQAFEWLIRGFLGLSKGTTFNRISRGGNRISIYWGAFAIFHLNNHQIVSLKPQNDSLLLSPLLFGNKQNGRLSVVRYLITQAQHFP